MGNFIFGLAVGVVGTCAVWYYRAQILGYASVEVEALRKRIRQLEGRE